MSKGGNTLGQDLRQSWLLLTPQERRQVVGLLVASLVTVALDLLSLAAILPVVLMVLQPDFWQSANLPAPLQEWLLSMPTRTLQFGILLTTIGLFSLKNGVGYWVQHRRISFFKALIVRLSEQSFEHIIDGTSLQAFLERHGGEGMQQLVFIPSSFANNVVKSLFTFFIEGSLLLVIIGIMLAYDPPVFLTALLALSPGVGLVFWLRRRTTARIGGTMKAVFNHYLQYVAETVRGYLDIALSGRKQSFVNRFTERSKNFHHTQQQILLLNATTPRLIETAAVIGIMSILGFLLLSEATAVRATVTLGIFLAGAYKLIPALTSLITAFTHFNTHRYTVAELHEFMPKPAPITPITFEGAVSLQQVSFRYGKDAFGLHHLTCTLERGQKVALVGPSGSGKTTLIHLLLGFFTPQQGSLQVDGKPLSPAEVRGWRQHVSYVPQNPLMLESSLAENIAFGIPEAEIEWERLTQVVQEAELEDLVAHLPEGLHTRVGTDGGTLSGGQRQRVALARALYQQRPVLILDEVTANLDEATEAAVLHTLVKLSHTQRTLLFISHRPQILAHCDAVWEIKAGELLCTVPTP